MKKHLVNNKCKEFTVNNIVRINNLIQEQSNEIERLKHKNALYIEGNNNSLNNCNNNNNINMKIEININPITKLDIKHIEIDKLKEIIEKYDQEKQLICGVDKFNSDKMNLLLSDYIKNMICDTEHPENHAVKYIKKHPPTYNTCIEDIDRNTVSVIKGLKDTCELLSDPILDQLKVKLKEFVLKYKKDTDLEFDYILYENAIRELKKELNKSNVKKALNSVLKNDILNNIEMKLTLSTAK